MAIRNYGDLLRYHNLIFGQSDTTEPQQATQRQPTETSGVIIAPKKPRGEAGRRRHWRQGRRITTESDQS